jgi:transcription antitermination protein NusB
MPRRSDARKIAMQLLYQIDVNADTGLEHVQESIQAELKKSELREFAEQLVSGVRGHLSEIDQLIESVAQNWRIERMAPTDRNVMRLAIYEMHHLETPSAVAIDEAVELAKTFGSGNSASFVNGIIDRLTPEVLNPTPAAGAAEPDVGGPS